MSREFVDSALAKGDECYGILDGETLAAYSWYSTKPTEIEEGGIAITFNPGYVYMYKGYTHPAYRGKRLHAIGMAMALKSYQDRGLKALVSYVMANNHSSLKSCYRLGYTDFGLIAVCNIGGRYHMWHSSGCGQYGMRVVRASQV